MESDLPLEVLTHILSYLLPMQSLSASLVCKRWLLATEPLLEDVFLVIREKLPTRFPDRPFSRIDFRTTHIGDECVQLINRLGPQLLHLRFHDCCVTTKQKEVLSCPSLLSFGANCADSLSLFKSLPRLESLDLRWASDLTDDTFMAFDRILDPNRLKVFAMPKAAVYEPLVLKRFYPEGKTVASHVSPYILSRAALEAFVTKRAATLKMLMLPETITPDAAIALSQIPGLRLRDVSFAGCRRAKEIANAVPVFCQKQPWLLTLNVDSLPPLVNNAILEICAELPRLILFSAAGCTRFLDRAFIALLAMPRLRSLCVSRCVAIHETTFFAASHMSPLLELRWLDLSYTRIQDKLLGDLLLRVPGLTVLNISGCDLSDATLARICPRLTRLCELSIRGCERVSDTGLGAIRDMGGLTRLDLRECTGLTYGGVLDYMCKRQGTQVQTSFILL